MKIPRHLKKVKKVTINKNELIDFEIKIKKLYENGSIKGPIHLMNNSENNLIKIFEYISDKDLVFSNWRCHLHAILHGVSQNSVKNQIIEGKSMGIMSKNPFFISSSIVGGTIPIALGAALSLKKKKSSKKVWCFLGDMTSETGGFYEAQKYAANFNLPIIFIIEDNEKSTNTPTKKVWNSEITYRKKNYNNIIYYKYKLDYPHHGTGKWVLF